MSTDQTFIDDVYLELVKVNGIEGKLSNDSFIAIQESLGVKRLV
jgi:hypothetical protein